MACDCRATCLLSYWPNAHPPSHFITTVKDFSTDCNFYPVFNTYNNMLAVAWLENNAVGRLNLKYSDAVSNPSVTPVVPGIGVNNQTIYIHTNIKNVELYADTQNTIVDSVDILDYSGNKFTLNTLTVSQNNGYEVENLPGEFKSVRFQQTFRQTQILNGFVSQAAQPDSTIQIPISSVIITIYYGKSNQIYQSFSTDVNGKFSVKMTPGNYTFEINVSDPSITFSQKFV